MCVCVCVGRVCVCILSHSSSLCVHSPLCLWSPPPLCSGWSWTSASIIWSRVTLRWGRERHTDNQSVIVCSCWVVRTHTLTHTPVPRGALFYFSSRINQWESNSSKQRGWRQEVNFRGEETLGRLSAARKLLRVKNPLFVLWWETESPALGVKHKDGVIQLWQQQQQQ